MRLQGLLVIQNYLKNECWCWQINLSSTNKRKNFKIVLANRENSNGMNKIIGIDKIKTHFSIKIEWIITQGRVEDRGRSVENLKNCW